MTLTVAFTVLGAKLPLRGANCSGSLGASHQIVMSFGVSLTSAIIQLICIVELRVLTLSGQSRIRLHWLMESICAGVNKSHVARVALEAG